MRVRVHAALFPNVRLLAVSEQSTRSATLNVAVTHPGTNEHNCCLTSNSDNTTTFPLSYCYSIYFDGFDLLILFDILTSLSYLTRLISFVGGTILLKRL